MNNTRSEAGILISIVSLHTHFADQANSNLNFTSTKFYCSVHNILPLFTNLIICIYPTPYFAMIALRHVRTVAKSAY